MEVNYVSEILEKVRELADPVPIYLTATPRGVKAPKTFGTVSFSTPMWIEQGSGIVSAKHDVHMVQCSIRFDSDTAEGALNLCMKMFWELTGFKPDNCGEMKASISGAWGRIEGDSRPHGFSQAIIFYFNTNLIRRTV